MLMPSRCQLQPYDFLIYLTLVDVIAEVYEDILCVKLMVLPFKMMPRKIQKHLFITLNK